MVFIKFLLEGNETAENIQNVHGKRLLNGWELRSIRLQRIGQTALRFDCIFRISGSPTVTRLEIRLQRIRQTARDSFASSPLAKIKVRLGQALGGDAHSRRI